MTNGEMWQEEFDRAEREWDRINDLDGFVGDKDALWEPLRRRLSSARMARFRGEDYLVWRLRYTDAA